MQLNYNDSKNYIEVPSSHLYHKLRETVSRGEFKKENEDRWYQADMNGKLLESKVYIMPDKDVLINNDSALNEIQEEMSNKVLELSKRGDLAADVLDIITAKWLNEVSHADAMIDITADDFLRERGLFKIVSGSGRRGGYTEKQKKAIQNQIDALSHTWIKASEMEVITESRGKREKMTCRRESSAIVLSSRISEVRKDGSTEAFVWRVRPGDIFAEYLFGPGRQTALMSKKALYYDPYRQKWEKRLARYFAWLWRINISRTKEGLLVKTLIQAIGMDFNEKKPSVTLKRLEKALNLLKADGVITAWDYEKERFSVSEYNWCKKWQESKIIISAPGEVIEQYNKISNKSNQ